MLTPIDYPKRIQTFARYIKEKGLDACVCTRTAALHYLGGAFMPWTGAIIVNASGESRLVYWAMDYERVRQEGWGMVGQTWGGGSPEFIDTVVSVLSEMGLATGRIGLDIFIPGSAQAAPGLLSAQDWLLLNQKLPNATLGNGIPCLEAMMLIKDQAEIERLKLAAAAADAGFEAALQCIRPGITENAVAGAVEEAIRRKGSIWAWSVTGGTEVGSGLRTGYLKGVTQQATDKRIEKGEMLIVDLHPMVELYLADFGMPVMLGTPSRDQQTLMDAWQAAVDTVMQNLKPGKPAKEACQKGFACYVQRGVESFGLPLFGHGLGTCARQRPFLSTSSTDIMQAGMVFALGGHLYRPGIGGLRLEYPMIMTETGAEPLCSHKASVYTVSA